MEVCVSTATPLLLTSSSALVAELASSSPAPSAADLRLLARSLQADAGLRLRCHSSALCLVRGWHAALRLLLSLPEKRSAADALGDATHAHTLALASLLCAQRRALSDGAAAAAIGAALTETGWLPFLERAGWSGEGAGEGVDSARQHAAVLMQAALAAEPDSPLEASQAAYAAALAASRSKSGWRELAALPFLRASLSLQAASARLELEDVAVEGERPMSSASLRTETLEALMRVNVTYHTVVSLLFCLGWLLHLYTARFLLAHSAWPSDQALGSSSSQLAQMRLWPLADAGAPPLSPRAVPWESVLPGLRFLTLVLVLFLGPAYLVALVAGRRLAARRLPARLYEPLLAGCMAADMLGYVVTDVVIARATGCVMEWPAFGAGLVSAVGMVLMDLHGPFTAPVMRWLFLLKAASLVVPLTLAGRPHLLLSNPGYAAQLAMLAVNCALAGRRVRAVLASARKKQE